MPRAGLDKAVVVKAAAEMANTEGLDSLSLSKLAEKLGVQTPSLYNHVRGLLGLYRELSLLSSRLLTEKVTDAAIGKSGGEAVMSLAQAFRQYIKDCPGLYAASLRVPRAEADADAELSASETKLVNVIGVVVASFGLEGDDLYHAVRAFRSAVHGFATLEAAGGFGMPIDLDESFRRLILLLVRDLEATRQ